MDKNRRKEIRGVFDKLGHMHREPWTHWSTSTADPVPLSTWDEFRDKKYGLITNIIVLGLEDPGTLPELIQYTRGELLGAALERRRVVIPRMVFVKQVVDALGEHIQRDVYAPKIVVYAHDNGFSLETVEGLRHFGINVIPIDVNDRSLVVDLRPEHGRDLGERNIDSMIICYGHASPGAILKRASTMGLPLPSYYRTDSDYEIVKHFELPSQAAPVLGAEQVWLLQLKGLFRRGVENEPQYWEAKARQNSDQDEAAEQVSLLDEYEERLAQLPRNLMVLVVRKGR